MKILKVLIECALMAVIAFIAAVNYIIFVFPNNFAPAGVDGICTMVQYMLDVNIGYLSLIVNIPLLICAAFTLNRDFALRTAVYVVSFSVCSILLKQTDIASFAYHTETSIVFAPIAAGVVRGLLYIPTFKFGGSSGGVDIIASIVKKKAPHVDLMNTIFVLNAIVAFLAFFVYGMKYEPVICSILYAFTTSTITNRMKARMNETVRYEIIVSDAHELCDKITEGLHLPATVLDGHGAYSGLGKQMVICVVDKQTVPKIEELIHTLSQAVVFKSVVDNSVNV